MHRMHITIAVVLAIAATATAAALASSRFNPMNVRSGRAATFVGTGWTCNNLGTSVVCRHGTARPFITLAERHPGSVIVIVHPSSGKAGLPSKNQQRGDPVPVYIFSSPPR